jgi:membrane protein
MRVLQERHEWLAHLARAAIRYVEQRGNHFAAAITFFSLLTAVPLLMVAFAAAGYVLSFNPALLTELENAIATSVPEGLSHAITPIIETAIDQRNAVAGFGLVAALYSGIWWMSNVREAVSAQWALPPPNPAALQRLLFDLAALVGLGIALTASFAITVIGTGFADAVLGLLGAPDDGWARTLFRAVGVALSLATDWLVFLWAITRLPRTDVAMPGAARAALLGAVGLEGLKQGMAIYLATVTASPSGAVFGSLLGLLLFTYLVARFVLFVTAWAATAQGDRGSVPVQSHGPATAERELVVRTGTSATTAIGAAAAAMLTGMLVGAWLRGRSGRR